MRADNFQSTEQVRNFLTKELEAAKEQIDGGSMKESFNEFVNRIINTLA